MDWELFDGFERVEKAKQRLAEEETARAELESQRLDTILDVWSSYYAVFTFLRRVQFTQAALRFVAGKLRRLAGIFRRWSGNHP